MPVEENATGTIGEKLLRQLKNKVGEGYRFISKPYAVVITYWFTVRPVDYITNGVSIQAFQLVSHL